MICHHQEGRHVFRDTRRDVASWYSSAAHATGEPIFQICPHSSSPEPVPSLQSQQVTPPSVNTYRMPAMGQLNAGCDVLLTWCWAERIPWALRSSIGNSHVVSPESIGMRGPSHERGTQPDFAAWAICHWLNRVPLHCGFTPRGGSGAGQCFSESWSDDWREHLWLIPLLAMKIKVQLPCSALKAAEIGTE